MASTQHTSPHPTRHQLDELDALMERMLALPVDPLDSSPVLASALELERPEAKPEKTVPHLPALEPRLQPAVVSTAVALESRLQPGAAELRVPSAKAGTPTPPAVSPLLLPFVWVNNGFAWCLGWFGPPGRWISGDMGRNVLAGIGIVMLLTALGWILADRLGLDLGQWGR
jgi:hypothetical protein